MYASNHAHVCVGKMPRAQRLIAVQFLAVGVVSVHWSNVVLREAL